MTLPANGALLVAAAFAVLADQGSKALVRRLLVDKPAGLVRWGSGFNWTLNPRGGVVVIPLRWAIIVWIAVLVGAGLTGAHASRSLGILGAIGLGLSFGGATSNLADRVLRGAIVDFIAVRDWLTFNLADVAMAAGTVLLVGRLA